MSNVKIVIDTTAISTSELDRLASTDPKESLNALIILLESIKAGTKKTTGTITVAIDKNATSAKALVGITGEVSVNDAIVLNGVSLVAKDITGTTGVQGHTGLWFQADVDPAVSGGSLVSCVNAQTSNKLTSITATNVSGAVTFTVDDVGAAGNGYKLTKTTGTNIAVVDFGATGLYIGTDGTGTDLSM